MTFIFLLIVVGILCTLLDNANGNP